MLFNLHLINSKIYSNYADVILLRFQCFVKKNGNLPRVIAYEICMIKGRNEIPVTRKGIPLCKFQCQEPMKMQFYNPMYYLAPFNGS